MSYSFFEQEENKTANALSGLQVEDLLRTGQRQKAGAEGVAVGTPGQLI